MSAPLSTTCIRTDNDTIFPSGNVPLNIGNHQGLRPEVVHWDIKKPLNLTGMEIDCNDMVTPCNNQHVRNQLCRDGRTRFFFLVHTSVGETRNNSSDPACWCRFACGDQNKKFHEIVVDVAAAGLNDENVFISDRFGYFYAGFTVGKFLDGDGNERDVKPDIVIPTQRVAIQGMPLGSDPRKLTAQPQPWRARDDYYLDATGQGWTGIQGGRDVPAKMRMELLWYILNEEKCE